MVVGARRPVQHRDRIIVHAALDLFDAPENHRALTAGVHQGRHRSGHRQLVAQPGGSRSPASNATPGGGYAARHQWRVDKAGHRPQNKRRQQPQALQESEETRTYDRPEQLGSPPSYGLGPESAAIRGPVQVNDSPVRARQPALSSPYWRRISAANVHLDRDHTSPLEENHRYPRPPPGYTEAYLNQHIDSWHVSDDRYQSGATNTSDHCDMGSLGGGNSQRGNERKYTRECPNSSGNQEKCSRFDEDFRGGPEIAGSYQASDRQYTPPRPHPDGDDDALHSIRRESESDYDRPRDRYNFDGREDGGDYQRTRYYPDAPSGSSNNDTSQSHGIFGNNMLSNRDGSSMARRGMHSTNGQQQELQAQTPNTCGPQRQLPPPSPRKIPASPRKSPGNSVHRQNKAVLHRDAKHGQQASEIARSPSSPVGTPRTRTPGSRDNERPKPEERNEALVKTASDMLLFSKKARHVEYTPCSLKEYRQQKPRAYVELGKLQPDLHTDELVAKRANAERVKEFSANLRRINSDAVAGVRRNLCQSIPKDNIQDSSRSRALEFARRIPLPRKRRPLNSDLQQQQQQQNTEENRVKAGRRGRLEGGGAVIEAAGRELTELEALEALYDDMRRKVQGARTTFRT